MDKAERSNMNYYQDITLRPDGDISLYFLWSKVFMRLHVALAEQKNRNGAAVIAAAFPEYSETALGAKLRLLSQEEESLEQLHAKEVFSHLVDYMHLTCVRKIVPSRIKGYAIYCRYHPDNSVHQKAKRYSRRHAQVSYEQALHIMKSKAIDIQMPYIQMKSWTNHNPFKLFICKRPAEKTAFYEFNTYGLSMNTSVPEF